MIVTEVQLGESRGIEGFLPYVPYVPGETSINFREKPYVPFYSATPNMEVSPQNVNNLLTQTNKNTDIIPSKINFLLIGGIVLSLGIIYFFTKRRFT